MKNGLVVLAAIVAVAVQVTPASAHFQQEPVLTRAEFPAIPQMQESTDWEADEEEDAASRILTRADFVGGVVSALYDKEDIDTCFWDITSPLPPRFTLVFKDVPTEHPAAKHLCVAMRDGLIRYGDGNFRPNDKITMAEAGKVFSRAFVLAPFAELDIQSPWYRHHLLALADRNVIPLNITSLTQFVTAGDAAEMLDRLMEKDRSRTGTSYEELLANTFGTPKKPAVPAAPATSTPATSSASSTPVKEEDTDAAMEEGKGE